MARRLWTCAPVGVQTGPLGMEKAEPVKIGAPCGPYAPDGGKRKQMDDEDDENGGGRLWGRGAT